jgi:hypothetical protein
MVCGPVPVSVVGTRSTHHWHSCAEGLHYHDSALLPHTDKAIGSVRLFFCLSAQKSQNLGIYMYMYRHLRDS